MKIQLKLKDRTLIAKLSGELDHHSAKTVKEMLENAIETKACVNLIFDLTGLTFMDSSGIGVIIGRYKLLQGIGGKVKIVSDKQSVNKLITMSGLTRLMEVCESVEQAIMNL
ncbi:MAG: anti-sigma F factor antagonist [Clostridia bacterium]|nr:anti-sigma F factor antagonist [Clostridia bacterium]